MKSFVLAFLTLLTVFSGETIAQQSLRIAGIDARASGVSYYLIRQGDKWTANNSASVSDENVEQVIVSTTPNGATFYLAAKPSEERNGRAKGFCSYGALGKSTRDKVGYTICTSAFTKTSSPVENSGGVTIFLATTMVYVDLDKAKLLSAITSSGLLDLIEADRHATYVNRFNGAATIEEMQKWLSTYKGQYDPDNLVLVIENKIESAREAQRIDSYRNAFANAVNSASLDGFIKSIERTGYDPDNLLQEARNRQQEAVKIELAAQRAEEQKRAMELAALEKQKKSAQEMAARQTATFRNGIKVGDETNCGPVVEIKRPMIKVYKVIELPGWPNEHWLRITDLYPSGLGSCGSLNGKLISSGY